ncbi:MAG: Uncharacterised protein [Owenweeksia sp. TMED14]|nr:MAG: Uncharacterised protein [Owenweeksia sp. TMED14]|tara:strand:- start:313 stop:1005 length:693 start_codon:yes stop_codon:yes gene_type:complete
MNDSIITAKNKMKKYIFILVFNLTWCSPLFIYAQSGSPLDLIKEVEKRTLEYKDQSFQFTLILDAKARDGKRIERINKGSINLVEQNGKLVFNGQTIFFEPGKLITVNNEDKEITVRLIDTSDANFSPLSVLTKYQNGTDFTWLESEIILGRSIQFIELTPKDQEDIVKVILGIDINSKQISSYREYGKNDVITKVNLTNYQVNQGVLLENVLFDRNSFKDYDYIAPNGM